MSYDEWKLRSPDDDRELQEGREWREPGRKCCDECPGDDTCEHAKYCMCGSPVDHTPWDGHSPVSMHDYYCEQIEDEPSDDAAELPAPPRAPLKAAQQEEP
jgi:hypothetical protein